MTIGLARIASFVSVLVAVTAARAQETPPPTTPPAPPANDLRSSAEAIERAYVASRSPEHLFRMASAYAALAESGGDAWDARLALIYFERYLATRGAKPSADQARAIERLRAIAGWRGGGLQPTRRSYPIHFLPYDRSNRYIVRAGSATCETPCSLELAPGLHTIETTGDGEIEADIVVPALPSMVRLQHSRNAMRIAGGIMIPVGALMAGLMWMLAFTCEGGGDECAIGHLIGWPVTGGTLLITGIALVAAAPPSTPPDANRVEITGGLTGLRVRF